MKNKQCADCRLGEHENYDDNVRLVVVKEPDRNKIVKRAYMCESHQEAYLSDGYRIYNQ